MSHPSQLIIERRGPVGLITLNRSEALNALTLEMIRGIRTVLAEWRDFDDIKMVVFQGAGERAFCAGGDVKKVYEAGVHLDDLDLKTALAKVYFAEEYRMNREMFHYPKPLVAFMNGITMGGGWGVAGACKIRVACETTAFAMPEVAIGFFPDVGSVYHLTRCPEKTGYWLALTGNAIRAADMMPMGLATHYMNFNDFGPCLEQMIEVGDLTMLDQFSDAPDPDQGHLFKHEHDIKKWFSASSVEGILDNLDQSDLWLAGETAKVMRTRSPTSLKLTLAYLRRMEGASFDAVTAMDYRLAVLLMRGHEFYEGVRAQLIDKDKNPKWRPATLGEVSDEIIEKHFGVELPDLDHVAAA